MRVILFLFSIFLGVISSYSQSVLPPNHLSPSDNSIDRHVSILLDWSVAANNSGYIVELDTTSSFNSPALQTATTQFSSRNFTHLRFGTTYYWRVATKGSVDTSAWSLPWSFTTRDQVTISSPNNNISLHSVEPVLIWQNVLGNTGYLYQVDSTANFNSSILINGIASINDVREAVDNLRFGTQYYWRVAAKTVGDTSQWSTIGSFITEDTAIIITPPNNDTIASIRIHLDWASFEGNTGYIYQIDTSSSFNSPLFRSITNGTNNSSTNIGGFRFGTRYYWRVAVINAVDTSSWTPLRSFVTDEYVTLISPTHNATVTSVSAQLDWSSYPGNNGYFFELDTTPSFNSSLLQSGLTSTNSSITTVNNLNFNTKYYWRVAVKGSIDTSKWSGPQTFYTAASVIPVSPIGNVSINTVSAQLDWTAYSGNNGYLYQIDTSQNFNSALLQNGTTPQNNSIVTVNGLKYGAKYYWRAAAKNSVDTSDWSLSESFFTRDIPSLISPANNTTIYRDNVTIDWLAISGSNGYLYQLDTSITFNSSSLVSGSTTSNSSQISISSLRFGTRYYWRAAAFNGVDTSDWSLVREFTTFDFVNHLSPSNGSINRATTLNLDWQGFLGQTSFMYELDTNANFSSPILQSGTVSNSSQVNVSNLRYGVTYFWRVAAINSADTSQWSTPWDFIIYDEVDLISPANNTTNRNVFATLDWIGSTGNNGYLYQIDNNPTFNSPNLISDTTATNVSQVQINLLYGTDYYWRVAVKNLADTSDWSTTWKFTTSYQLGPPILISPANGAIISPSINTLFDWNAVTNSNAYDIQVSDTNTFDNLLFDSQVNITQDSLGPFASGTTYYWRVRAKNSLGNSPWSVTQIFTTQISVGLSESILEKIAIYPNPANENIFINAKNTYHLKIFDLKGSLVFEQNSTSTQNQKISITHLNSGIYILEISSAEEIRRIKLVKE